MWDPRYYVIYCLIQSFRKDQPRILFFLKNQELGVLKCEEASL